ncbi:carbamoyltransferase HypF [Roseovarius sp. A-2]|uniref:carbamoyltransferase HypF n=1 Tax=Roseovarius sp. A-2 TaxID=1570360 RepID=UPI0009B50A59|nr:carbamoyltransferase HypF [Roseovarius sp. A-2]GAW34867.1 carbamoyltransferase HypF [Roseovarius sp. A-2]
MTGARITVCGQVQGVGFRPTVWRLAQEMGLTGDVSNTGEGVVIRLWGEGVATFPDKLHGALPPLARIERLDMTPLSDPAPCRFEITASQGGEMRGSVTPDAATCADCLAEIRDPFARRYRYPFANCTNCGPRFSIVRAAPYDRDKTTMAPFDMCTPCAAEYGDPADRRFHAQPIACGRCGPNIWIEKLGCGAVNLEAFSMLDDVDATGGMILNGHIVAIRGLGGVHLACDATNSRAVAELRRRKARAGKAFALMVRDLDVLRAYCEVSDVEADILSGPAAPIVLLKARPNSLPEGIAPGLDRLGVMLPYTPFYHMILRRIGRPVVMTSGNPSGQPQCTDNHDTRTRLAGIADFACLHDRDIANRIDDSVVRVDLGRARVLRRARGYAPQALELPDGFATAPDILALGAEQKNTFCLIKDGRAILSQHMGDLEDAATHADTARNLDLYANLFDHAPAVVAVDLHPAYLSTQRGFEMADGRPVIEVQHHHAHIAACLAENARPLAAAPVLGIALDGTGMGDDGTIWGGEFLICDYRGYRRAGCLKPVALPGGAAAVREPWRNAYAHLMAEMGWAEFAMNFAELPLFERMQALPRDTLDAMIRSGTNAPLASSCGRLFDAAAAIAGLAWDRQDYEGEAAMRFEAALDPAALNESDDLAYPFSIPLMGGRGLPYIEPLAVWRAMLGDLVLQTPVGTMSARFHRGLAQAVVDMARRLTADTAIDTVALSGGCFQNKTLFELIHHGLERAGLRVLSHADYPANDGGISLGQAVIALATTQAEDASCA